MLWDAGGTDIRWEFKQQERNGIVRYRDGKWDHSSELDVFVYASKRSLEDAGDQEDMVAGSRCLGPVEDSNGERLSGGARLEDPQDLL